MTTFSDTFTTGGQTQLHKLRMLKQVLGATFKVSLCIFVLAFAALLYLDHSWQDLWLVMVYGKAYFLANCPEGFASISPTSLIYLADGSSQVVSDVMILHSEYIAQQMQYFTSSFIKKVIQALVFGFVSSGLVSWFWIYIGRQKQEKKVLSGFELVDAKRLSKSILKLGASSYTIANVPMPKNGEFQHMMLTGTTGSGKSNAIQQLLEQVRAQGDQAIVVDTTGGIFARFYEEGRDILLNPLDARCSNWNLWDEALSEGEFCDYILDEIAESLIADTQSHDKFWIQSARQVFAESVSYLIKQNRKSYQALVEMTLQIPLKDLHQRLQNTTVAALVDPAIDKTALSVRASLANPLKILQTLEDTDDGIALLNLIPNDDKSWLFLSCLPDQREFLKPLFSSQISLIIKGLMRRQTQNPQRTWIIIDELASLNKLPSLLTGLAEVRKYGGCFVIGFQDLSQLEVIYGNQAVKTLSNLTGTKLLFRSIDADVATRTARYLGEQEKQESNESISFGAHQMRDGVNLSNQKQIKPVVTASQIMMLSDLEAYLKFPQNLSVTKVKFTYTNLEKKTTEFVQKSIKIRITNFQDAGLINEKSTTSPTNSLPVIALPVNKPNVFDQEAVTASNEVKMNMTYDRS